MQSLKLLEESFFKSHLSYIRLLYSIYDYMTIYDYLYDVYDMRKLYFKPVV